MGCGGASEHRHRAGANGVTGFHSAAATPAGDWRHIVRFGRNVASYKFALGAVLLELGARQQTFVSLADLAVPYAAALCGHLKLEDKQTTSAQSRFLSLRTRRKSAFVGDRGVVAALAAVPGDEHRPRGRADGH